MSLLKFMNWNSTISIRRNTILQNIFCSSILTFHYNNVKSLINIYVESIFCHFRYFKHYKKQRCIYLLPSSLLSMKDDGDILICISVKNVFTFNFENAFFNNDNSNTYEFIFKTLFKIVQWNVFTKKKSLKIRVEYLKVQNK